MKKNKLIFDAYDAVIALCLRHGRGCARARNFLPKTRKEDRAALGGKLKAYNCIIDFCKIKKENYANKEAKDT